MVSERMRRRIDALLDEADEATTARRWDEVAEKASAVLAIESDNADAHAFLEMADAALRRAGSTGERSTEAKRSGADGESEAATSTPEQPASFVGGRYEVRRFLGEGGKKRVFLAHDALLDRDIAFSLIKTEGLDQQGRERVMREARAMGRLTHPHIVSIYDIGEHASIDGTLQPYLVQELMAGGDVEGLLEHSEGGLPLAQALRITIEVSRGLEFAHGQGVVHRDLKPGNVWLTADGTAKIGDLGLAVQLGQSRLTSHGMMVGTYQYMPPEQALGGEITPQADLYSLGAMLYELVTGRTPFEGDTPTAVISQHLNAQPVAPSWHTEHCPPDLEALILRLLEKEPGKRPASASEVVAALERVDPEGHSASHSDSQANPLDRLARGVFVGRERELEQLRDALNAAMEGRGSVAMLVGEPGIGKTRTLQELETYARMRGAEVYWGRTHESSGMPPYWPWVQVGRAWGASHDLSQLAANPELLRLFPDLPRFAPAFAGLQAPEQRDPATAQFLLFDAYAQWMRAQAQPTPWLVVLDDLHWADKPTLQLLQYLARELPNMPLLIVGTYRDTDLVRTHPLSEALAELNREHGFLRITLKGLERVEVATYVRQRTATKVSDSLLDRVYEETEGNPFFLSEVVNLMTQEGTLTDSVSDLALPDGVREALGRRLDRVSEGTNELLRVAAVAGRQFAYDTLKAVSEYDDAALLHLIEEGLAARVIEELSAPGRYRFTHALMQETLLDELSTTRKVRMHGQIAEVIEQRYGERTEEQAARLARHFMESSTLTEAHREKALHYSALAARQAEAQSAWAEAVRHRENVVALTDESDRGALAAALTELGRVAQHAVEWRLAWRSLMQALDLFRTLGDGLGFATAANIAVFTPVERHRADSLIREALELLGERSIELRAKLLYRLLWLGGPLPDRDDVYSRLVSAAQATKSPEVLAGLKEVDALRAARTGDLLQVVELRGEAKLLFEQMGDRMNAARVSNGRAIALAGLGGIDEALTEVRAARDYCAATYQRQFAGFADQQLATLYWMRGELDAFTATVDRIPEENFAREQFTGFLLTAQGRHAEALEHMPPAGWRGNDSMMRAVRGGRARVLWHAGKHDQARAEYSEFIRLWTDDDDGRVDFGVQCLDESLGSLAPRDDLETIVANERAREQGQWRISFHGGSVDRQAAQLHLWMGDLVQARIHAERARDFCVEQRAIVEQGRCEQLLAEIELSEGNREAALPLLDSAASIFDRFGLRLFLDQVIAKKDILKA